MAECTQDHTLTDIFISHAGIYVEIDYTVNVSPVLTDVLTVFDNTFEENNINAERGRDTLYIRLLFTKIADLQYGRHNLIYIK